MSKFLFCIIILVSFFSKSQSFAPAPGNPGSTAIHYDSSIIIDWASQVIVNRGPMNILNPSSGLASHGSENHAVGVATGLQVISLGDGGEAIATFNNPIINGIGPDFAIFENGFTDNYIELAFVEVSSDGINFFRFNSISETPSLIQSTNFTYTDCRYIHNLAGKYRYNYGTPFDLEELDGLIGLDINHITHVKIIDVIGSIDPTYGSFDSQGNIINDPFPTEFETGGFDLDAIAVIHSETQNLNQLKDIDVTFFPNPSQGDFVIQSGQELFFTIYDFQGRKLISGLVNGICKLNMEKYKPGIYSINFKSDSKSISSKILIY